MSERKLCYSTGAFGETMPEAIFGGAAETRRKTFDPGFVEKFRIIAGLLMMVAGLYLGLFTAGASEGLGFLTLMASPFVMVTDKG